MNFVILACALFALGLYGVMSRRDIIGVLASVEVMLGSGTVLLVGLSSSMTAASGVRPDPGALGAIGVLIIVVAAAEAAVGLAVLVSVARILHTTQVDGLMEVKG
ncbi:MAG: NADH-quinone oxidoreductase subunit K [Actinobacteria bacterium]|nr:NADH-quinone oxidoreductase subunit K [Actinomycetota bacterium]